MRDLETALAELISVTEGPAMGQPWVPADFVSDTTGEAFATVVATILNAVLSGDLVPKALLAAANEAAADFVGNEAPSFPDEVAWCVEDLAQAIRAITHADAHAALDAMISRAREEVLAPIRDAVTQYHLALDRHDNGKIAGYRLQDAVQKLLGMPWRQGAALRANATDASEGER